MNPKDELTPEEKLLRLIRHSGKKPPKEQLMSRNSDSRDTPFKSASPLIDFKKSKFKESRILFAQIKSVNFVLINRLILWVIFVALAFFVWELYFNQTDIHTPIDYSYRQKEVPPEQREVKPLSYYIEEISKRDLFKAGLQKAESKHAVPASLTFKELIKDFSLLGIVSGDKPQVIIEDKKLNKTYFLYKGDFLGEIKIEEIHPERVILEFRGERVSLFL